MESKHGAVWQNADVIVVGAGLSGLVSAAEAYNAGRRVLILDQEPEASLGGQAPRPSGAPRGPRDDRRRPNPASRSTPARRSPSRRGDAARANRRGTARQRTEAYVNFAAGEKRAWLHALGVRFFPLVQWAERGGYDAQGHGNSVPRFHVVWGTGPGILAPFLSKLEEGVTAGRVQFAFRHRATELMLDGGIVTGVRGQRLAASAVERGQESSREVTGEFSVEAGAVIVTTGGIGGNHPMVREQWPNGTGPKHMLTGVPASVDGHFQQAVASAGGALINTDRMWHYPEGIHNPDPVWPNHGIRILSGPSPLWLDATGHRLPVPLFPGFDSLGTLRHLERTGHDHSWFVLNKSIIAKEFALSGSEQNPDLTGKDVKLLAKRALPGVTGPVQKFLDAGIDFVQAATAQELAGKMNALVHSELIDPEGLHETLVARDRQVTSGLGKDTQINAIREARRFTTDKLMRVVPPHAMLAAEHGPLIAVRLTTLTRKSLGGLTTDLNARVLDAAGAPIPGLYAAGEAAGFGGGGVHGYRSLEGTFLGGCLFSGRTAGRHAAGTSQA